MGSAVHAHDPIAILEVGAPETRDLVDQPVVVIAAKGAVRDADLQLNTDKYVDRFLAEHPSVGPADWDTMKTMTNYWVRIWVECTPVSVWWWPTGRLNDQAPEIWHSPIDTIYPESDPKPFAKATPRVQWPAEAWRSRAEQVLLQFPKPVLTSLTKGDGYPLPFPVNKAELEDEGFVIEMSEYNPAQSVGSASLTFGALATFTGDLEIQDRGLFFKVERLIGNLPSIFQNEGEAFEAMAARQEQELARRGKAMPIIRKGYWNC